MDVSVTNSQFSTEEVSLLLLQSHQRMAGPSGRLAFRPSKPQSPCVNPAVCNSRILGFEKIWYQIWLKDAWWKMVPDACPVVRTWFFSDNIAFLLWRSWLFAVCMSRGHESDQFWPNPHLGLKIDTAEFLTVVCSTLYKEHWTWYRSPWSRFHHPWQIDKDCSLDVRGTFGGLDNR